MQALWTAAQHKLPIVYAVMRKEYSILKSFAVLEETPGVIVVRTQPQTAML